MDPEYHFRSGVHQCVRSTPLFVSCLFLPSVDVRHREGKHRTAPTTDKVNLNLRSKYKETQVHIDSSIAKYGNQRFVLYVCSRTGIAYSLLLLVSFLSMPSLCPLAS